VRAPPLSLTGGQLPSRAPGPYIAPIAAGDFRDGMMTVSRAVPDHRHYVAGARRCNSRVLRPIVNATATEFLRAGAL
jgi:hypothetical protein